MWTALGRFHNKTKEEKNPNEIWQNKSLLKKKHCNHYANSAELDRQTGFLDRLHVSCYVLISQGDKISQNCMGWKKNWKLGSQARF